MKNDDGFATIALRLIESPNAKARENGRFLFRSLRSASPPEAIPDLIRVLESPHGDTASFAAAVLGNLTWPSSDATEALVYTLYNSPSSSTREGAAEALVRHGRNNPLVSTALVDALTDRNRLVRDSARRSLEAIDFDLRSAIPGLRKIAKHHGGFEIRSIAKELADSLESPPPAPARNPAPTPHARP